MDFYLNDDKYKQKEILRREVLKKRTSLTAEEVSEKSQKITDIITTSNFFLNSHSIMCYVDFKNEVSTKALICKALEAGKIVSVPHISSYGGIKEMNAARLRDWDNDLEAGFYGILTPRKEMLEFIEPQRIDLILIPGVAFGMDKSRIGYGAGYYDRFLSQVGKDCIKAGIAFEIQIVDRIPSETHDIKMDFIVTENKII